MRSWEMKEVNKWLKINDCHLVSAYVGELERDRSELLEACKEAKRLYDHFSLSPLAAASKYGDNYEPPTDEEYLEMRKALEQAIAKAEGITK